MPISKVTDRIMVEPPLDMGYARRTTRRHFVFAGFQQQVVCPMSFESIVIIVVIVLVVLFVLGYFRRGRMGG